MLFLEPDRHKGSDLPSRIEGADDGVAVPDQHREMGGVINVARLHSKSFGLFEFPGLPHDGGHGVPAVERLLQQCRANETCCTQERYFHCLPLHLANNRTWLADLHSQHGYRSAIDTLDWESDDLTLLSGGEHVKYGQVMIRRRN